MNIKEIMKRYAQILKLLKDFNDLSLELSSVAVTGNLELISERSKKLARTASRLQKICSELGAEDVQEFIDKLSTEDDFIIYFIKKARD